MAIVTELVNLISFKGSLKPLKALREGLDDSIALGLGLVATLTAAVTSVTAFTVATLGSVDAIAQLSRETGIAVEDIQDLQFAAEVTGSSSESVMSSLASLTQKIGDAALRGSDDFNRIGISVRKNNGDLKNAADILGDVQGRFSGMEQAEKFSFASALGIDSSLVKLLGKTGSEMDALKKKSRALGVVTQEQAEDTIKFNDSLTVLSFGVSAVQRQIALSLAPEIQDLAEGFTDLLTENKDFIKNGIQVSIKWIGHISTAVGNFLGVIDSIIEKTIGWEAALMGIGLALFIAFAPTYPVALFLAGLVIVVDDLVKAFDGGQSTIAAFSKELLGWDISEFLHDLNELLHMDFSEFKRMLVQLEKDFQKSDLGVGLKFWQNPIKFAGEAAYDLIKGPEKPRNIIDRHSLGGTPGVVNNFRFDINGQNPQDTANAIDSKIRQNEYRQAVYDEGHGGR